MKWESIQTPRILVVDDNRRIHEDFDLVFFNRQHNSGLEADLNEICGHFEQPAFSKPTYELDHALSGNEAIEKTQSALAEGRPYQVAFVDIRMPGMDGVETIERIWSIDSRIQAVICTAFADYRWEDLARRLGQSDNLLVLKKPFDHIEAFQLASTLSEKWFLARQAALKFEQMELLVAQRTQRVLDLQRREAQRPHELEMIKLRLLTKLPQEFRGPLTLILSGLERMRGQKQERPEEAQVRRSTERLLHLAEESLSLCNLNEDDFRLKLAEGDLGHFLQGALAPFKLVANQHKVEFEFQSNENSWPAHFDSLKLEKVLFNILSHSLEMSPEKGRVSLHAQFNPGTMQLVIQASRTETPDAESSEWLDLRLALSKELMRLQGGTLTWENLAPNAEAGSQFPGTRFIISLPLQDGGLAVQPMVQNESPVAPISSPTIEEESSMKEQPLIMLVQANLDLTLSIQQGFGPDHRIIQVKNGAQGLIQARETVPDIVIVEVTLSIQDGIELCRKLKNDELTSHIPVILITAHEWKSGQLQALEAGADDYLLQPVQLSLLKARMDNLRESRQKVQELFKRLKQLHPRDLAANQSDAVFIRRVIDLVEESMADWDFDLEIMARKLAVSRRQLFRKLHAAAGCSPNTFIRTLRLKRAAQLLMESKLTVTEITYAVGFSDLKYFRTIFREYYGVPPGEFLKRSKTPAE